MRRMMGFCLTAWLLGSGAASADSITIGIAQLTTTGSFVCFTDPVCSASGNSVVIGSGPGATRLTFTGVNTLVPMRNEVVPLSLGTFAASSESATFPNRVNTIQPIVGFLLTLTQTTTITETRQSWLAFGPGGRTVLPFMQGSTHLAVYTGPEAGAYNLMVYSFDPFTFEIPMNGSVDLTAKAGVVPEPATLALVGSGLVGAMLARRRRRPGR